MQKYQLLVTLFQTVLSDFTLYVGGGGQTIHRYENLAIGLNYKNIPAC